MKLTYNSQKNDKKLISTAALICIIYLFIRLQVNKSLRKISKPLNHYGWLDIRY